MSAAAYREPYMFPAGILTLVVHGAFFALLFLGFTWQTLPPAVMQVELWQSLPEDRVAPVETVAPPPAPKVEEAVRPSPAPKAEKLKAPDIALPDKKKEKTKPVEKKPAKKPVEKPAETKSLEIERQKQDAAIAEQQASREQAAKAAAIDSVVAEYKGKIQKKILHNIVMSTKVETDALAIFRVTLLPGGSVLQVKQVKSSGNPAYDSAVERAILKSDPLPLPPDVALFSKFRELELKFRPEE
jgi:colicin import membrane protein